MALSLQIKAHITQDLTIFSVDIKCLKIQSESFHSAILKIILFNKNTLVCKRAISDRSLHLITSASPSLYSIQSDFHPAVTMEFIPTAFKTKI